MGVPHYTPTGFPNRKELAASRKIRDEFLLIEVGLDEMNCHVLSLIVKPWAGPAVKDVFLVLPFHCQFVGGYNVLIDVPVGGADRATPFFYNYTNGNQFVPTDPDGDNGIMDAGSTLSLGSDTDTAGEVVGGYAQDLTDPVNEFQAGDVMRIRLNQADNDNSRSFMAMRLRKLS
jgi:hypothetical protein